MSKDFGLALVKELCPICCKEMDGPIIMGNTFNAKRAKQINEMNGQVIGFSDKPCPECQKHIDDGCFFIIGIDADKTEDFGNPYRSGHIIGIKKECDFVQNLEKKLRNHNYIFMDYKNMIACGMIKNE